MKEDSCEIPGVLVGSSSAGPTECAVPMNSSQQLDMTQPRGVNSQHNFFVLQFSPTSCHLVMSRACVACLPAHVAVDCRHGASDAIHEKRPLIISLTALPIGVEVVAVAVC